MELSPIEWAIRPLERYADFSGRAPRAEYWWFVLATSIVTGIAFYIDARMARPIFANYGPFRTMLLVVLALPTYGVTVRRLHDSNSSGWWVLARLAGWFFMFAPTIGFDRSFFEQSSSWLKVVLVVCGLGWLCADIALLVLLFIRGTNGANSYGPDPYGPDQLEEVFA